MPRRGTCGRAERSPASSVVEWRGFIRGGMAWLRAALWRMAADPQPIEMPPMAYTSTIQRWVCCTPVRLRCFQETLRCPLELADHWLREYFGGSSAESFEV